MMRLAGTLLLVCVTFGAGCVEQAQRFHPDLASGADRGFPDRAATTDAREAEWRRHDGTFPADAAPQPEFQLGPDGASGADRTAKLDGAAKPDAPVAAELLLFEGTNLQFTTADNGFHPLIKPGDPLPAGNWKTPLDYYQGELRIRYVIESPPDQAAGKIHACIWTMGNADGDGKDYFPESCADQVAFSGTGEFFGKQLTPSSWWKNAGVPLDFSHPERFLIRAVLRGPSGCNVTTYSVASSCWNLWPDYQNLKFRVTMVMVAPGRTFSGWGNYP